MKTVSSILNADLHCHSVVSDGTLTPEALAARAAANGVELWALTDHDEISGQHRAAAVEVDGRGHAAAPEAGAVVVGVAADGHHLAGGVHHAGHGGADIGRGVVQRRCLWRRLVLAQVHDRAVAAGGIGI